MVVKQFMNFELGALNAMTVPVDMSIVAEFEPLAHFPVPEPDYAVLRPDWHSDLHWISANRQDSFETFQSAFDRLGIADHVAQYLDLDRAPRLYAGFLLLRTRCTETNFHFDWIDTGNEAFTLITPLDETARGFGLLYEKVNGAIGEYDYRPGEAIIFGDKFLHSTKPGESEKPVAMLCFQFGTDKMAHWGKIMETAGYQSLFIRRPDGHYAARRNGLLGARWSTLRA